MDFVALGIQVVLLIVGFVLLIKGSDFFVDGSSSIASLLKIPTLIVGLTIVAFGTSAPEAAVSITSALAGSNALAVSNVIGSNLFNILLIIGICALLKELELEKKVLNTDLPFLVIVTLIASAFILISWNITRIEGIILVFILIGYIIYLVYSTKKSEASQEDEKPKMVYTKKLSTMYNFYQGTKKLFSNINNKISKFMKKDVNNKTKENKNIDDKYLINKVNLTPRNGIINDNNLMLNKK